MTTKLKKSKSEIKKKRTSSKNADSAKKSNNKDSNVMFSTISSEAWEYMNDDNTSY